MRAQLRFVEPGPTLLLCAAIGPGSAAHRWRAAQHPGHDCVRDTERTKWPQSRSSRN